MVSGVGFAVIGCITSDVTTARNSPTFKQYFLLPAPVSTDRASNEMLQGLSGLVFDKEVDGRLYFWSLSDRGPNLDPVEVNGKRIRPFLDPSFQPRIYHFSVPKNVGPARIERAVYLTDFDGKVMRGITPCGHCQDEESPVRSDGSALPCDPTGIDPESLGRDSEGNFWIGEEYRPSVLQFSPTGRLLKAYVPAGEPSNLEPFGNVNGNASKSLILPILPANFRQRRPNRGIEGLTIKDHRLYLMLQSPLKSDAISPQLSTIQVVKIDTRQDTVVDEFRYPISAPKIDKIGDISLEDEDHLLILEQNSETGPNSFHRIYRIDVKAKASHPESHLKRLPATKELVLDLVSAGFDQFEKLEGLTTLPGDQIAVVNDNDFGVTRGTVPRTVLGVFKVPGRM